MQMLQTAAILFAIAALGGVLMAGIRFARKVNPPAWVAMLHGLLAASGLTLLAYALCTQPLGSAHDTATVALVLFLVAAAGGAVMSLAYKWKNRLLPAWLVVVHATAAVLGFLVLLFAAFASA
ncbi:hypothetical protein LK996_09275 [Lysobacter sp. A6]|uniref:Uncharacterized protein n=1 Tax=Noviluteimonas lactosilytica TaxID=2888523 RepID=A0ABS8JI85_9GAMM|nr:hypothetical protein [Lysobacter lactosilyticus]MCC8363264.1 hypothetical protein [Lysobacter lactosilyticus]